MNKDITPATIHAALAEVMNPREIDHHYSDLYVKVTPASREIVSRFEYSHMVQTFIDNIDRELWYDIPFCYNPNVEKVK